MAGYFGSKRSSSLVSATDITLDGAKLKSSGDSITKSDGTTAVLSESSGTVTVTTNNAVIEGSSSGNLVRITQTGSGNALVVEDEANPDSTPFVVNSSGNVGIGMSDPIDNLSVAGSNDRIVSFGNSTDASNLTRMYVTNDAGTGEGFFQIESYSLRFKQNGTLRMFIDSSGNVNISNLTASSDVQTDASKNLTTTSDARLKNDLGVITDSAINVVQQIIPKYFSWKNDENNTQQLGFFAQDIYPVLPEAAPRALKYIEVGKDENDEPILEQVFDEDGNPDYEWGFTDRPIIAMCVKAIQEQQTLIESQQSNIDALTARIEALETQP